MDETNIAEDLVQEQSPDTAVVTSVGPYRELSSGEYVTGITTVASLGLEVAAIFTNLGFEAAKLGTGLGLNIAKQSVAMASFFLSIRNEDEESPLLGSLTTPIDLGLTMVASTLTFAEFLALSGIQWSHKAVSTSLVAAKESIGVLDTFFGSNDTARCLAEFVALVRREWSIRGDEPSVPANFGAFTVLGTMKALTAWIVLQAVTAEHWNRMVMRHVTEIIVFGSNSEVTSRRESITMNTDREQELDEADNEEVMFITRTESTGDSDGGSIVEGEILSRRMSLNSESSEFLTAPESVWSESASPITTALPDYHPFRSSNSPTSREDIRELLHNLKRYSKFSLGAYGRDGLALFGVPLPPIPAPEEYTRSPNPHHFTFAHHTQTRLEEVSGFSQKRQSSAASDENTSPSYYLIRDHNSSSIILALRGTFSVNDLVVDLTCEEVDFQVPSDFPSPTAETYKVHSGILASAKNLATPGQGTVFNALRKALEDNHDYGLVIIGHSLGGGIGSILALLFASPTTRATTVASGLPPGRPVHAFAFAAPCTMSATLSRRAEGLVTSLVHADDVITRLSVGSVRDLRNIVAWMAEKEMGEALYVSIIKKGLIYKNEGYNADPDQKREIENWFVSIRTTLQANMQSEKLYPAGTVYWVLPMKAARVGSAESVAAVQEDDPKEGQYKLYKIDNVEKVLSEIIFSSNMMSDHFPQQYENVTSQL